MKLFGSLLIILSCSAYGYFKTYSLKKRCSNLLELKSVLESLKSQIGFLKYDLETAFLNASKNSSVSALFSDCAKNIGTLGVDVSWKKSLDTHADSLFFTVSDIGILKKLSRELGKTNTENQLKHLTLISTLTDELLNDAQSQYKLKGSIYQSTGVAIGIFLVLLLI